MNEVEKGQSLIETVIFNFLIALGIIVLWSIGQEEISKHIQSLLDFVGMPIP